MVSIQDVREALDDYPDLKDNKIKKGIDMASDVLYGINPDWETHPNHENAHLQASIAQTLILHFPQNSNNYQFMMQQSAEMISSLWSSSFMLRRKSGFARVINPVDEDDLVGC